MRAFPKILHAMKTHQQRSPASEIEEMYAIAVREHGPQGRSSRMLRQELDRELRAGRDARGSPALSSSGRDGARRSHPR